MSVLVQIRSVAYTSAANLDGMAIVNNLFCIIPPGVVFTTINIEGLADLNIEDTIEENQRVYNTSLSFRTCDKQPADIRRSVFLVESVRGRRYLVGSASRPYPIYKETNHFPDRPTDSTLKQVNVSWRSNTTPFIVKD